MICRDCKKDLPMTMFWSEPRVKTGRFPMCKPCGNEAARLKRIAQLERVNESLTRDGFAPKPFIAKVRWNQSDRDFVFANYGPMNAVEIARVIGRSPAAVRQMVRSGKRVGSQP